jgi:hypothetical protein
MVNEDGATTCLDPLGDSPSEVSSQSDDEDDLSIEELASGFEKLMHAYNKLHKEHVNLKRDHDALLSKFDDVCNDKMMIMHANEKLKIDNDVLSSKIDSISLENENAMFKIDETRNELISFKENHICSSSFDSVFDEEFNVVKNRIECLNSTLIDCVHNHKNLENMCAKKQASSHKKTTHHAHMYAKVHKCTVCGRKGHLAKFCYDTHTRVQKPVSVGTIVPNISHTHFIPRTHSHAPIEHHKRDVVYSCTLCGRKGHLAKFCFDAKKICFMKKNKTPHVLQKDSFRAHTHVDRMYAQPLHCTHCGRKGHTKDFCFDRLRAIDAPTWVRNPKSFGFGVKTPNMFDRAHIPSFLGPKKFWAPKPR